MDERVSELHSLSDTLALAKEIAPRLRSGGVLLLEGDLGAGKTTFVQALAKVYGITRTVTSPTFTLANEYRLPQGGKLIHFDLYRLATPEGLYDLGLIDALESGARVVIEWPERAEAVLRLEVPHRLRLQLSGMDDVRIARFKEEDIEKKDD
ncbi:MAG: tRNA (adenosine(37)-N6)-threonylcarbamoyltransferase complex ATPase subunit type 1 TsaE [Kiritimatiellia bacterium]